jgi:hypothetical protein
VDAVLVERVIFAMVANRLARDWGDEADRDGGDDASEAVQAAVRTWSHSTDHRADLPQVIIAMAVTREGIPVRVWTFPGDTATQTLIRRVKDDVGGWERNRVI